MSDVHYVTRTATGLSHGNTLGLYRMWTVILHIDVWVASQSAQCARPGGSPAQPGTPDGGQPPAQDGSAGTANADSSGAGTVAQGDPGAAQGAQSTPDSWRLVNDDGGYDKTLQRSDAVQTEAKLLSLRFTDVTPDGTYSLYHCLPSGTQLPVFLSVPFASLEEHGEETPAPSFETSTLPAMEPAPAPLSNDPLLLHDPVDVTLDPAWYANYAWYGSDALPEDSDDDSQPDVQDASQSQPASSDSSQPDSNPANSAASPDKGQDSAAA